LDFDFPEAEFVFGFVCAVGTDYRKVLEALENGLKKFRYVAKTIQISEQLSRFNLGIPLPNSPEYNRIDSRMDAGNRACEEAGRDDFLALVAVSQINTSREVDSANKLPVPHERTAHIVLTLKRPEEVIALRRIYGAGFLLVGIYATEDERLRHLTENFDIPKKKAQALIARDLKESVPHGQSTRDTFHRADVFVRMKDSSFRDELWRFLDLVFGHQFYTPLIDEYGMFLAQTASFRSADLSRQVGAAILSDDGEILALGCNDVPKAGGGLYWPGDNDHRDYQKGFDSNEKRRDALIENVVEKLRADIPAEERLATGKQLLADSALKDLTEFGRAVHAEMEALLSAARIGVSPRGATLYTTTFPCHNCTRHIIAAGIKRVIYIEPYPKSKAEELHFDAIRLEEHGEGQSNGNGKVVFEPFVGVGPRRYSDLFSTTLISGKKINREENGKKKEWKRATASPRVPMLPNSYLQRELVAVDEIEATMKRLSN
jgi:deoxycytidylate deaminase